MLVRLGTPVPCEPKSVPGRLFWESPIQALGEPLKFGEWFLLQPSDAGWLGPVLGRFSKGRRYWAAYRNTTWTHSFYGQPATRSGGSTLPRLVRPGVKSKKPTAHLALGRLFSLK